MEKVINKIVALVFLAMAAIQYNDPDPLYWIVAYALPACIAATAGTGLERIHVTFASIGLVGAGLLISASGFLDYVAAGDFASIGDKMGAQPYVEPAREFLGLLLALAALLWYARRYRIGPAPHPAG